MLGQPLNAEVEIVSLQGGEGDTLAARLATGEAFRQANIELTPALLSIKFAVVRKSDGRYVMAMTSKQPVNEPYVDMLVELNWSNGRLVREYTFLLDPPEYAGPPKATRAPLAVADLPRTTPVQPVEVAPPGPAAPATAVPAARGSADQAAPAEAAAPPQAVTAEPAVPARVAPAEPIAPAEAAPSTEASPGPPAEDLRPSSAPVQVGAAPATEVPATPVQEPAVDVSYQVKRGDTLSKIAMRNTVEGVSLQQMLVAMLRANHEAFVGDNMNRLRAGKIINIPDREAAAAVSPLDARRIVVAQFGDFKEYRRNLGGAVAAAPTPQDSGRQVSGAITEQAKEKPAPQKGAAKDQLRLSGADDAKRGGTAAGTAAADDLAAKEKALKEANERIALLEKNLQDLQKLGQIKSEAGAQLQQQAQAAKAGQGQSPKTAQLEGPSKAAPAPKAETPKVPGAAKPAEAAKAAPAAKAAEVAKAPDAAKGAEPAKAPVAAKGPEPAKGAEAAKAPVAATAPGLAKAPEAAKAPEVAKAADAGKAAEVAAKAAVPAKPEAPKATPAAALKPAPQPAASEPGFFDELVDSPYALGGAAVAVILLAGYAVYAWRKKRTAQFVSGVMSVTPSDVNSVLGTAGGRNVDTGSSSFQSDFSQAGIGKIDTEEIDPIAEADVYMAYGRDAQAEEILREALAKDSTRQAIRLKLLEIYANRKDARAFEAAANDLRSATGGRGPDWEKAASLGISIDPTNTLYGGKPSAAGARNVAAAVPDSETTQQAAPVNLDFDIGAATSTNPAPDINLDAGTPSQAGAAPAGLDFDLGLGGDKPANEAPAILEAPAAPAADTGLMSIDFNLPSSEPPAQPVPEAAPAAPATDLGAIDFDIGLPGSSEPKTEAKTEVAPKLPAIELGAISLDLGTPGGGNGSGSAPDARWQEVATKLDLAKAYEEMGDKDGARELLKEVTKEGDPAQQQQAQTMLQSLG
jgi:pilus assembly protein FimV